MIRMNEIFADEKCFVFGDTNTQVHKTNPNSDNWIREIS